MFRTSFEVDTRRAPLYVLNWSATYNVEELDRFWASFCQIAMSDNRTNFVVISDMRGSRMPTGDERTRMSLAVNAQRDYLRRHCLMCAMLFDNRAFRTAVNAWTMLIKPPFPMRAFETLPEAEVACTTALYKAASAPAMVR